MFHFSNSHLNIFPEKYQSIATVINFQAPANLIRSFLFVTIDSLGKFD